MLRLLTYLSPSIPLGLYEAIADYLAARLDRDVEVASETRHSGPGPGTQNPFAEDRADVGFICAPSYVWLVAQQPASIALAGVAPVHDDARNGGRAEYYAELVVHEDNPARSFDDLAGQRFAFNDPSSLSGYHCVLDRLNVNGRDADFFGTVRQSGSHHRSLELLASREVDVAAIDANALAFMRSVGFDLGIRVLETLGPFPVQPVVVRASMAQAERNAIAAALLDMHYASGGEPLRRFGVLQFAAIDDAYYDSVRSNMRARGALDR